MPGEIARTHRCLDECRVNGSEVIVRGWILHREGGHLQHVDVEVFSPREYRVQSVALQASPDLARAYPDSAGAAQSRFLVTVVTADQAPVENSPEPLLLVLRASFSTGQTSSWCVAWNLLTLPATMLDRVGGAPEVGCEFLGYFLDYAKLQRDSHVLDLGCGVGRMAIPLQAYLSPAGRYWGFDVDRVAIEWCVNAIEKLDPRFRFRHVPARNAAYNPRSKTALTDLRLEVAAESVTFACAASLFTHLRAGDARHYWQELGRVLRPGGRVLATAFLVDPAGANRMTLQGKELSFVPVDADTWTTDVAIPEKATGFPRTLFSSWAEAAGLQLEQFIPGTWNGRPDGQSCQDMLVFTKRGA